MLSRMPGSYCGDYERDPSWCTTNIDTYAGVYSRNRNQGTRGSAAAIDDVDLSAANVELCSSVSTCGMKGNLSMVSECRHYQMRYRKLRVQPESDTVRSAETWVS